MGITSIPAGKINALRKFAEEARKVPDDLPEGWSKSTIDPAAVVALFRRLHVKAEYVLRAYQFRSGDNGNGIIWAMPIGSEFLEPDQCPKLTDRFLGPPKPHKAIGNFMKAIDGDGSPFSYLCASVLQRELCEFGAIWHGCEWSTHRIHGRSPFQPSFRQSLPEEERITDLPEWRWSAFCPDRWSPQVEKRENGSVVVTFLTDSSLGVQSIVRHIDTYRAGTYCFTTKKKVLATGPGGFVF